MQAEEAGNTEGTGMGTGTAEVELEVPAAVELAALDTAGAWFQMAEQMERSKHPLVKPGLREPVQQTELMAPVNVVNDLETVMEVGFEVLEVEAAHLEQEGREVQVVENGLGLDAVAEWLLVAEPPPAAVCQHVQIRYFLKTGYQFWVSGASQGGAGSPQFPACLAKSAPLLGPP